MLLFELKFLEDGGYTRSSWWRAPYIFEDSPICPNFADSARPHPCSECLLLEFVPEDLRDQNVPCRSIPLNEKGQTVDSLYHTATQEEIEDALREWLQREIRRIEGELRPATDN